MHQHRLIALATLLFASQLAPREAGAVDAQLECPAGAQLETTRRGSGSGAWCIAPDLMGRRQKNGPFRHWRADGSLEREGGYVDGKRNGLWVEYDAKGRAHREAEYRFGQLLSSTGKSEGDAPAPIAARPTAAPAPLPTAPAPASTAPAPEPTPNEAEDALVERDDFGNRVETRKNGGSGVGADLVFENAFSSIQGALVYAPTIDLSIDFGQFGLETQWGVGVLSPPGLPAIATPLNPTLLLVGQIDYAGLELKLGLGSSIPVLSFGTDVDGLLRTATAMMVPAIHGMRGFWLAMPELPVVVIPIEGKWRRDALVLDFEATSFFAIPIHGGSSDLGLQLGAGATYGIDLFRFGGGLHLVLPGVTSGLGLLSVSPKVGVALGPTEIYASFDATVLRPEALSVGVGFLWATNIGIQVAID